MKLHWGEPNNADLRFEIGSCSHKGEDGQRMIFRRRLRHRITGVYGLSFGWGRFIGFMRFAESEEQHERIK